MTISETFIGPFCKIRNTVIPNRPSFENKECNGLVYHFNLIVSAENYK